MRNKFNLILLVTVIVLAIAVVGLLTWQDGGLATRQFHAIYLQTGDMYFGELEIFPKFGLKNVHVLQLGQGETPPSIQKLTDAVWGPKDFMEINRSQVVWMAEIDPKKELGAFFTQGPSALQGSGALPTQQEAGQTAPLE